MIKIIAKQSTKLNRFYNIIFDNISKDNKQDLGLLIQLVEHRMLDKAEDGILPESRSDWIDVYAGQPERGDDYYIAFYDASLDFFYKDRDEDRLMLKFSKLKFQHLLVSWNRISVTNPQYLLITQDAVGWIDLQGKDELTIEEINLVESYKRNKETLAGKK